MNWLALRNAIHGRPPETEVEMDPTLLHKVLPGRLKKGPELNFILGGYAILIIALFYLLIMARIGLAIVKSGSDLLIQAIRWWRESEQKPQ